MNSSRKGAARRLAVLIAIVIAVFLAMKFLPVEQWLRRFNEWVSQMGVAGILIFIAVYAGATVLLAPGAILTIGAGFAFGLWKGFLAVSAGSTLGAALAFLVARFIARDRIEAMVKQNEKFRRIDSAISREGPKLIFLLRLSLVIPFNLSNYFYGLTAVRFWPYVFASWIGMMPATFLFVYIGAAGKTVAAAATSTEAATWRWQYWALMSVGLTATVLVIIWVTRIARNALNKSKSTKQSLPPF